MINSKVAQRLDFAVDYDGDNFELNPQLKFIMAKAVEPIELKKQLQ